MPMPGGVLNALASSVLAMLAEPAKQEVYMLLGVSTQIEKMKAKLTDLNNFLADADRRNVTDLSVQAWVRELREAMYDATDILDLCQLKAMEQGPSQDKGCLKPLLFCMRNPLHAHDVGSRIKKLNQRLDEIKARGTAFSFINLGSHEDNSKQVVSAPLGTRETSSRLDESGLVGDKIEEDTKILVDLLTKEEKTYQEYKKIRVFAIVGVGGIGKTTLAQKIFNNDTIEQEFTKRIWLSVNQDPNDKDILSKTITAAGGDLHVGGNTKENMESTLEEVLNGHKTLLIMDDVWNCHAWEGVLSVPFANANLAHGSCILVTTRLDTVARRMKAVEPYHRIKKLEPEDAWLLLKKQVVGNINEEPLVEMLKRIGMGIIEKCDYLPLAVKVMGGLLRQRRIRQSEWEGVLHDSVWSLAQMPEELNYAIYLSYKDLGPCLKSCFLHYSLLPKDTIFDIDDIVSMWISEGFVHETCPDLEKKGFVHETCPDLENTGRGYYNELIERNLIEPDTAYIDQVVSNMHDIVRSFGQYISRHEALVSHNSEIDICDRLNSQKFIRLSLVETGGTNSKLDWSSLQAQKSLRTLISVGHITIKPSDSLLSFSSLRTLHIRDANFNELVESLDQLKHLRYLSIMLTNTSKLPETIAKMKFLQCINLTGCKNLMKLPDGIVKLQHLRFLSLFGTRINDMPRGFSNLCNLRTLYGFRAHMDGDWCSLQELGPLPHLSLLHIIDIKNVSSPSYATQARLAEKKGLIVLALNCTSKLGYVGELVKEHEEISEEEKIQIEEIFDELCPPSCLQTLEIQGYFGRRLPRWMMLTAVMPLGNLRILTMDDLDCCTELPSGLCQIPFLEKLQIVRAPAIKRIGHEFVQPNHQLKVAFPRLQKLTFDGFVEWEDWDWEKNMNAMPILDRLKVSMCKLRRMPPGLAFQARVLKELYIYDIKHLNCLENLPSVVRLDVSRNLDLERISNLPKLHKLFIGKCPKIKVLEGMPALHRLDLMDFDIERVPRYLQDVKPRHLLLDCSLPLLTSIATGKSGPEWDKFSHIQQVKAYAFYEGKKRNKCVMYTRDPFHFDTNISHSAIAQGRSQRKCLAYLTMCPIEDNWSPVAQLANAEERLPLCVRFRCNAYRHLAHWLRQTCLHCSELHVAYCC